MLVVDDDPDMVCMLREVLQNAGFDVHGAASGTDAQCAMTACAYAVIVLDLRLKGEDGLVVARRMRQMASTPIIMVSGSSEETDRVLLLETAADDFLVKPFSARELTARVRAVLRRCDASPGPAALSFGPAPAADREMLQFGDWTLDLTLRELRRGDGLCPLTPGEFRLLEAFVSQPRRIWTRDELLEQTRSADIEVFDRTIDVQILRLRRKIEPNPRHPVYINTERGRGYLFATEVRRVRRPSMR